MDDLISRQAALNLFPNDSLYWDTNDGYISPHYARTLLMTLPSVQPFHNITMTDVMKYIDDMPEDDWLEFTECLACRGWELQKRTAKWCGGDFA